MRGVTLFILSLAVQAALFEKRDEWSFDDSFCTGPTVLEVFNTLLRQLRLSVDYELTGSYDGSTNIGTKIIKAHEERQLQEAVIKTIGESAAYPSYLGSLDCII